MSRKSRRASRGILSCPPTPAEPPRGLSLHSGLRGGFGVRPLPPTPEEISAMYGPAKTLGAPEDVQMAMDAQLADSGIYSLLQHTLGMGMGVAPQFMGYAALQNIAQNGLIRACIETVADDMTRAWIEFKREGEGGENGDEGEALLTDLAQAVKRFELQRHFHEAAELVGYEGGAFIFIDTGAVGDLLAHPLNLSRFSGELRPGGSLRFVVVDPVNVFPGDYNSLSPLRPDYFRPGWWWVLGERVHASRLIRLTANEVPVLLRPTYNFLGIPQAQVLWDYVLHFQECRAAEARLLTKFSLTVFKTKMDDILFASGGTAELDARIRYMIQSMSNDGVLAVDKESEDVIKLETPLSGVTDIVRQSLEILAALNRTPAVKLLGISPSGFNATGESDIRNYYDHIRSQQEKVLRDGVKKALDCIQLYLRGKIDPSITFDFAPLGEEDRAALSAYQKTKADTVAVYMDRDIISPEEARKVLADDPDSGFAGIDPDDVPEGNGMPGDLPTGGEEGQLGDPDIDDMDKAGAVYDVAQDAEIWRTSKGGKRFQVGTETGEIVKGNVGQPRYGYESKPLESTKPDTARYEALVKEHGGDHKKAAHEYFREKLQGRHVTARTDEGTIEACFTGGGWREIKKDMSADPVKASLVPSMPDIIAAGRYAPEAPTHAHPDIERFHTYTKTVQTVEGPKEVIVDVAERAKPELNQPKHQVYSMAREGTKNYATRTEKAPTGDSGFPLMEVGAYGPMFPPSIPGGTGDGRDATTRAEKILATMYEVVNIRWADGQGGHAHG